MKKILSICFLIIQMTVFSQEKLIGLFSTYQMAESDFSSYEFKENNCFEYKVSGCIGTDKIGTGHFKINDSFLILFFDNYKKDSQNKIQILKIDSKDKSSTIHNFNLLIEKEKKSKE